MDDSYIPTGGVSAWQEEVPSGHTPVPYQLLPDQSSPTLISDWLAVFLSFSFFKLFFVFCFFTGSFETRDILFSAC